MFNGATTVSAAISSILVQTYSDFELIIADNCSTDGTFEICSQFAQQDDRIRLVRQKENIGASKNFEYVVEQARGTYFMWAAADDVRSPDFIEINLRFLEANPDYSASTSPNCFEGGRKAEDCVNFAIRGNFEDRVLTFLDHCWDSHAIFYSVMRTRDIRRCDLLGESFLGFDWAIDLYLVKQGRINRTCSGQLVLGRNGLSNKGNTWRMFRKSAMSWPFPFYRFSLYTWHLTAGCGLRSRIKIALRLINLNRSAAYHQLYAELFPVYLRHIRPWIKGDNLK